MASSYVARNIFNNLRAHAEANNGVVNEDVVQAAYASTEAGFRSVVDSSFLSDPSVLSVGSSSLIAYLAEGTMLVSNLGSSRAVLGCLKDDNEIVAVQLSQDHDPSIKEVREELMSENAADPYIVVHRAGAWRVKGTSLVTRCIGQFHLKDSKFTSPSEEYGPLHSPAISAIPSIVLHTLRPNDQFVIFGSSTFWRVISNKEAVQIVKANGRKGGAKILAEQASRKIEQLNNFPRRRSYSKMLRLGISERPLRFDFSVVVVYIDNPRTNERPLEIEGSSSNKVMNGCSDSPGQSEDAMAVD